MRIAHILFFVIGALLGIGATLLLLPSVEPLEAPVTALPVATDATEELKRMRMLIDQKEAALAEQYAAIQKLEEELDSAREAQSNAETLLRLRTPRDDDTTPDERRAQRAERFQRALQREAERRSADIAERFDLTEEQSAALLALYEKQAEYRLAAGIARTNGETPPTWEGTSMEEALAQIFTPEQQAAYDAYENAVQTSRAETGATARMNRIAPDLGLNVGQKDQVFAIYYEEMMARMQNDSNPGQSAPQVDFNARMEQVLTPEQYSQWQQMETEQRRRGPPGFP